MPSSGVQTCARSEEHTSELQHGSISYAVSLDRKSTRLNSSHGSISYAVFCLKKKKNKKHSRQIIQSDRRRSQRTFDHTLQSTCSSTRVYLSALCLFVCLFFFFFFFLNDTAPPEIYPFPPHAAFRF